MHSRSHDAISPEITASDYADSDLPIRMAAGRFRLPSRTWVIRSPADRAAINMARDEALMDRARDEGIAIMRLYAWSVPAISFGRNEAIKGRFDATRLADSGYDLVRRPTGGRALLHVHEVTYAIALPLPSIHGWRSAYDTVNRVLCTALRSLGIGAHIVGDMESTAIPPAGALCFTAPAAGEIVVGNAKLVASAVWRNRDSFLQQGSILVDGDQEPLRLLGDVDSAELGGVATLRGCGAPTDFELVGNAISGALSEHSSVVEMSPDAGLQRDTESRVSHFRDISWLWRR